MTMMERLLRARCGAKEESPYVSFFNFTPILLHPSAWFLFVLISAARNKRVLFYFLPCLFSTICQDTDRDIIHLLVLLAYM